MKEKKLEKKKEVEEEIGEELVFTLNECEVRCPLCENNRPILLSAESDMENIKWLKLSLFCPICKSIGKILLSNALLSHKHFKKSKKKHIEYVG